MRLVGVNDLQARSAYQPVIQEQGGRWIAYIGHHGGSAPDPTSGGATETNGTSIVDVTNPRRPVYLAHLPPTNGTSAQFVQVCSGDDLPQGEAGATYLLRADGSVGHEIWDVTVPENPTFVSVVTSDLGSTHKNWWECDTGIAYLAADLTPDGWERRGMKVVDLKDPHNPATIRDFDLRGAEPGNPESPYGGTMHEATTDGQYVYAGYGTSSNGVMQILDREELIHGDPNDNVAPIVAELELPPYWGAHTVWPLNGMDLAEFEPFANGTPHTPRNFAVVVDESTANECAEMHQMVFFVDITDPTHPWPVSNYHVDEPEGQFCDRGGRFGAHSMNWSFTDKFYRKLIFVSYFNAGVRVIDVRNPYHPEEVGFFIPATTANTAPRDGLIAIQTNNVEVDDRGYIYIVDRANTGLHILELTGKAKQIANQP